MFNDYRLDLYFKKDVALNALDTIWELHKNVFAESPYLIQILNEQLKL